MLHLENFFEKSFALLLTTPRQHKNQEKGLCRTKKDDKLKKENQGKEQTL